MKYKNTLFSKNLLSWYDINKRTLPWRSESDPYRIWLSEIMLQQTQTERVSHYYFKWLKRFPSLKSVAKAKEESLLKVWEGLGYYNRCRNFHSATKTILKDYNGKIPNEFELFRALPGIGDYTAAAVLSIAFNIPLPAIDGNIKRVMARILRMKTITKYNFRRVQKELEKFIDKTRPGDFNQALMDLGNQICRPNQAHCYACPMNSFCKAAKTDHPEKYPRPEVSKDIPHYDVVVGLIWKKGRFLILKRDNRKHLGGLWELPGGKIDYRESPEKALIREIKEECNVDVILGKNTEPIKHRYSHFAITVRAFHCQLHNGKKVFSNQPNRWITPQQIIEFPFPKANHKLFAKINFEADNV
jgi:A/G-specific adenine glycosylase